jgi:syntaxin 8
LSHAISRQRDLSLNISSELELHNNLLEETDQALDHTESRLRRAATRLETVGRRTARENSATCLIVMLVVVLLVLIVLFK